VIGAVTIAKVIGARHAVAADEPWLAPDA